MGTPLKDIDLSTEFPLPHTHPENAEAAHAHPYAPATHTHILTDLPHTHSQYAADNHTHPTTAPQAHKTTHATGGSDALTPADIGAAPTAHNHDAAYFTEAEVTTLLSGKADAGHTHAGGGNAPTARTILTADVTAPSAANSIGDVTGLSFAVTAGVRYSFRFVIPYTAAAATTGSRWSINGPATSFLSYHSMYTLTATSRTFNEGLNAYNLPAASNATSLAAGNIAVIEGFITPSANGTVIARFASEILNSAVVAKAGAYVEFGTL